MIIVLIILGVIGVWIYSDAKARGDPQPGLWAVGAMLLAIVVVPIWLIKRPAKIALPVAPREALKRCPFCAEDIKAAAVICKHCHRDVAAA